MYWECLHSKSFQTNQTKGLALKVLTCLFKYPETKFFSKMKIFAQWARIYKAGHFLVFTKKKKSPCPAHHRSSPVGGAVGAKVKQVTMQLFHRKEPGSNRYIITCSCNNSGSQSLGLEHPGLKPSSRLDFKRVRQPTDFSGTISVLANWHVCKCYSWIKTRLHLSRLSSI